MVELSPRLKLQLPEVSTDSMADGDNVLSHNYDIIDYNAHCVVVNVKEDIVNPFDGMHIHTLSDGRNLIRKAGQWAAFAEPPVASGGGLKGNTLSTVKQVVNNDSTENKLTQITFTPEVGKRYLIKSSISMGIFGGAYSFVELRLRWSVGTNVTTSGTLIASQEEILNNGSSSLTGSGADKSVIFFDEIFPNNTTQLTVGLFAFGWSFGLGSSSVQPMVLGNSAGFETYSTFSIIDWGS